MKTTILSTRWIIIIILVVGTGAVFYFIDNILERSVAKDDERIVVSNEVTPQPTAEFVTATFDPVSSISPVSPVSSIREGIGPTSRSPEELQAIINSAIRAQDQGDYQQAIDLTNSLLDDDPTDFIALNIRGSAYLALGDFEQAFMDYSAAIEQEPLFPHAYYNRGRVNRLMGKYEQALTDLQKSIDLAPREFGYKSNGNIGLIYYMQGEYEESLKALSKSIELNIEDKADVYFYRGETYTAMENYEEAATDYQAAVERFPDFSMAYRELAFARYKLGQLDEATEALVQAKTISSRHPTGFLYQALILLAYGQADRATGPLEQGINSVNDLSAAERKALVDRMIQELESLAEESPETSKQIQPFIERLTALN